MDSTENRNVKDRLLTLTLSSVEEEREAKTGLIRLLTLTLSSVEEQRETGWGVSSDVWRPLGLRSPRR
jgi:hypothetical protein